MFEEFSMRMELRKIFRCAFEWNTLKIILALFHVTSTIFLGGVAMGGKINTF